MTNTGTKYGKMPTTGWSYGLMTGIYRHKNSKHAKAILINKKEYRNSVFKVITVYGYIFPINRVRVRSRNLIPFR